MSITPESFVRRVDELIAEKNHFKAENARLKAEVERLRASSFVTAVPVEQYERLVKAGEAMADAAYAHCMCQDCEELRDQWRDAKRGNQP